jgi:amino acid adenylation domain-containing protein
LSNSAKQTGAAISPFSSIRDLLIYYASTAHSREALLGPGSDPVTYGELWDQVEALVHELRNFGITRSDRVGVVLPNGMEAAIAMVGVAAGAVCAPLDPAFTPDEWRRCLIDLRLAALLTKSDMDVASRAVARSLGIPIIELSPRLKGPKALGQRAAGPVEFTTTDDDAFVLLTSGSTSRSKMVPLTHASVCLSAYNVGAVLDLEPADRLLNVQPLYHVHGLVAGVLAALAAGSSVVCSPGFETDAFFGLLMEFRPTWYTAVPTIHRAVLSAAGRHSCRQTSLRLIRSASSALPPNVLTGLEDVFGVPVIETYGTTEAASQVAANPLGARKVGSVGRPVGVEIAVMDRNGLQMSAGRRGEIVLRGPTITRGYDNDATSTNESFHDGWFRTGDIGYIDQDGYVFIAGRIKDVINRGGQEISPAEVEEILLKYPGVLEAAAFPVPHSRLGVDIAAAVVVQPDAEVDALTLREFARKHLARYKVPGLIHIVPEIPRGSAGKIKRGELAKVFSKAVPPARLEKFYRRAAAGSNLEHQLAGIWANLLDVEWVGVDQDVLALGADSLTMTQMLSRLFTSFGAVLSLKHLLEYPTPKALANTLRRLPKHQNVRMAAGDVSSGSSSTQLSFQQKRIYFLSKLDPVGHSYHIVEVARFTGSLDVFVLETSIRSIVERHESLRTTFRELCGDPLQTVGTSRLRVELVDLTSTLESRRAATIQRKAKRLLRQRFDIEYTPPIRVQLMKFGDNDHALVTKIHHLISDGWSQRVFWEELEAFYAANLSGTIAQLPELSIQYRTFVQWQSAWLRSRAAEEQVEYWRKQLRGVSDLSLPSDRPRPEKSTGRGSRYSFKLSRALSRGIRALSNTHSVTVFMTLLAAFQCLLYRYSGQEDIAVGSLIANRNRFEVEPLIGMFANTVVLRTDLSGDPFFSDVLQRVRQVTLNAHANQDLPFEYVLSALRAARNLDCSNLFRVMFILQSAAPKTPNISQLSVQFVDVDPGIARFDLTLEITDEDEHLVGSFEYSTDLFDPATIARMVTHFRVLLRALVTTPEQRISALSMIPRSERKRLLVDWNRTQTKFSAAEDLTTNFLAHARHTPNATAISTAEGEFSYGELADRVSAIADRLVEHGVGAEVLVVLLGQRDADFLAAMLAVHLAAGAFLPVEPTIPIQRFLQIIRHSKTPLVVAGRGCSKVVDAALSSMASHNRPQVLRLARVKKAMTRQPVSARRLSPSNLAYVIYTSGTTGLPKGAMIEQRGFLNHLLFQVVDLQLSGSDVIAQTAPQSFDISIWQFLAPLMVGARVHVCATEVMRDATLLMQEIRREGITVLQIVPALLREMLRRGPNEPAFGSLGRLRWLISTGEALSPDLCRDWFRYFPQVPLVNAYGPAECSDDVATHCFTKPPGPDLAIPIGRPIANTQLYVVDSHMQPVPIGIVGELCVGGSGVGRGYLNDPEQSRRSFLTDPFSKSEGARLYRTGDLARWRANGTLEYLGRTDRQLKIRGHRIEPEEIENALIEHPGVESAVVHLRNDIGRDVRLIAYVVPASRTEPDVNELRNFLSTSLPEYMIPSGVIFVQKFPLTPHGKIDRGALMALSRVKIAKERFVAPRNSTERIIGKIWRDLLGIEKIGILDNFFGLGGHSLLAGQVISRIANTFGVPLPIRTLFESPTIEALARCVGQADKMSLREPPPRITREKRYGPKSVSISQEHVLRIECELPGFPQFNLPNAFRLKGPLNISAFGRSLAEVVRRHEALRAGFVWENKLRPVLTAASIKSDELLVVHDVAATTRCRASYSKALLLKKVKLELEQEAWTPFDLRCAPLFRVRLWRLGQDDHILLFVLHHIIVDGWSVGLFMQEISKFYSAFVDGRAADLSAPRLQFSDFARWQRRWSISQAATQQFAYWKKQLRNLHPMFPTNARIERTLLSSAVSHEPIVLRNSLIAHLKGLSRRKGVTLFMILLAGFKAMLLVRSGRNDICVATAMANRSQPTAEKIIGPLENTTLIRTRLDADMSFDEAINRVRDSVLDAYVRQELPFETLIARLADEECVDPASVVQVFFIIQDALDVQLDLPDVAVRRFGNQYRSGQAVLPIDRTWLTVMLKQSTSGMVGTCSYKSAILKHKRIKQWIADYKIMLVKASADPKMSLGRLADSWPECI